MQRGVYVRGTPSATTRENLVEAFATFGTVDTALASNCDRGFAHVYFRSAAAANAAAARGSVLLAGRPVRVTLCKSKAEQLAEAERS